MVMLLGAGTSSMVVKNRQRKKAYDAGRGTNPLRELLYMVPVVGTGLAINDAIHEPTGWNTGNAVASGLLDLLGLKGVTQMLKQPFKGYKGLKNYAPVGRFHGDTPVRSAPFMDVFRGQFPTHTSGSLGYGHKYRVIGNNKGLADVMENGILPKHKAYKDLDQVYWAQDEPLREYTRHGALLLSYDKNGKAVFNVGNFGNPVSSATNPISFWDDAVALHGRYPFTSWYHEIPKTAEGIAHANRLGYMNRFIERPIRTGLPWYLAYKYYNSKRSLKKAGGSIHINPANRGKFTETMRRTGKTAEELSHSSNPLTRQRAQFVLNARKWNK